RERRRGFPEVIYCDGKSPEAIVEIARTLLDRNGLAFGTRCAEQSAREVLDALGAGSYDAVSRTFRAGDPRPQFTTIPTAVIAAGTSDMPVAEEACATLETFGAPVDRMYDVGVAGI